MPRGNNESVQVLLHAVTIAFCDEPYLDSGASAQQQMTDHGRVLGYTVFAVLGDDYVPQGSNPRIGPQTDAYNGEP